MNEEDAEMIAREEGLPPVDAIEQERVLRAFREMRPAFDSLYANAPSPSVRERLSIAVAIDVFRSKRNCWTLRDRRDALDRHLLAEPDLAYLAGGYPVPAGREHFRDMLLRRRSDRSLTSAAFHALIATAPASDRLPMSRTVALVEDMPDSLIVTRSLVRDAIGGAVSAQALLGDAFLHGHELAPDNDLARFWLSKAAGNGDSGSADLLRTLG